MSEKQEALPDAAAYMFSDPESLPHHVRMASIIAVGRSIVDGSPMVVAVPRPQEGRLSLKEFKGARDKAVTDAGGDPSKMSFPDTILPTGWRDYMPEGM